MVGAAAVTSAPVRPRESTPRWSRGQNTRKSARSPREIIEFHPALASDFDRAASFELKSLAQRALGFFSHLYPASAAVRFHSRGCVHRVAPNVIEQLASADHASHRRA